MKNNQLPVRPMLEVCVEDAGALQAAITGGADRVELCSALPLGGLTPSAALIEAAAQAPVPVHVLLRPRGGDFFYDAAEEELISRDLQRAAATGVAGVVIGASRRNSELDVALLGRLVACAREAGEKRGAPLSLTLHRAFDLCPDPVASLEQAISLGFDRLLTSGGAATAMAGRTVLAALVSQARGRIRILAGGGINPHNVGAILSTGVDEVHGSCQMPVEQPDPRLVALGFVAAHPKRIDASRVSALIAAIKSWPQQRDSGATNI
jgi:copper homeostasis protein CutC